MEYIGSWVLKENLAIFENPTGFDEVKAYVKKWHEDAYSTFSDSIPCEAVVSGRRLLVNWDRDRGIAYLVTLMGVKK